MLSMLQRKLLFSRKVKPGYEREYDKWLRRYLILGKNVPGYVGVTIITQGGTNSAIRHIIYRFSDKARGSFIIMPWEDNPRTYKNCVQESSHGGRRQKSK